MSNSIVSRPKAQALRSMRSKCLSKQIVLSNLFHAVLVLTVFDCFPSYFDFFFILL